VNSLNAVPVIGQPVAYGLGFIMLVLVVFTGSWARSLVTVAHEGGHMAMAVVTGRGYSRFTLADGGGGATHDIASHWGFGVILVLLAGYPAPCLLGLGGAALIAEGHAWSVVWAGLFLLLIAFFQAGNPLALAFTLLAFIGVGLAAVLGTPYVQVVVAVGLVWWLLIGGAYWSAKYLFEGGTSDAGRLAQTTFIPAALWDLLFTAIGIATLIAGIKYLL
jgi:hypothetical protein